MFSQFRPFMLSILEKMHIREPKKILGRWTIDTCSQKMKRKIDQSNEDHCGPCGYSSPPSDKEIILYDNTPTGLAKIPKKYWHYDKTINREHKHPLK